MNSGRVPALELCNVCKTFGGLKATDNISIEVKEHEIYGIIGPNGAGKTTLFNLITGVVPLSSGQIRSAKSVLQERFRISACSILRRLWKIS